MKLPAQKSLLRCLLSKTALLAVLLVQSTVSVFPQGMNSSPDDFTANPGGTIGCDYNPERILIKPKRNTRGEQMRQLHAKAQGRLHRAYPRLGNLQVVTLAKGKDVKEALREYRKSGLVEYAEPDFRYHTKATPNDLDSALWGLNNTGQSGGTSGADIDAVSAWDIRTSASSVIVAVSDSGIRYTHEDLAQNMWVNPGETPGNGIDDDANGYIDDVYGPNIVTGSGDPSDDVGHGTHVAGTIGAVGNNNKGVVGVAWQVKLMAVKWIDSTGSGYLSDGIESIDYAVARGAKIINASWGGGCYSQSLYDAIEAAGQSGVIFVAAAGNDYLDNDQFYTYPASYNLDNIVSVSATTRNDDLATFSNHGRYKVNIAAPGKDIKSTWNTSDTAYETISGTSMATPHVSGILALIVAAVPSQTYAQQIAHLYAGVDRLVALDGRIVTGGRANLNQSLLSATASAPANDSFANRVTLSGGDVTTYIFNIGGSKETGEPNHAGSSGGASVWWSWTPDFSGAVTIETEGSTFDTLLNVYTGTSVSGLSSVAANDDSGIGSSTASRVTFSVTQGTTYQIAVDGKSGATGAIKLLVVRSPANDSFANSTKASGDFIWFIASNSGATKETSEPNHASVSGGHSVWWSYKAPISGNVTVTTDGSSFDTVLAVYTGTSVSGLTLVDSNNDDSSGDLGGKTSSVSFSATAGTTYHIAVDGVAGAAGIIKLSGGCHYTVTDIGQHNSLDTVPYSINDLDDVVGLTTPTYSAFYWSGGTMTDMGSLGSGGSRAFAINNQREAVGCSSGTIGSASDTYAFLWTPNNGMSFLFQTPVTTAFGADINQNSDVAGFAWTHLVDTTPIGPVYASQAYFFDSTFLSIDTLGGWSANARGINDQAYIVGASQITSSGDPLAAPYHAYMWYANVLTDIGTFGGPSSFAYEINNKGEVVGNATHPGRTAHPFLWTKHRMLDLGALGCNAGGATSINDSSDVVGASATSQGTYHAFLWKNTGLVDMNRLINQSTNTMTLLRNNDINQKGKIVGYGMPANSTDLHGYVLTPPTVLKLKNFQFSSGSFSFDISGGASLSCDIEAASAIDGTWSVVGTCTLSSSGTGSYQETISSGTTEKYYRVKSGSVLSVNAGGFLKKSLPSGFCAVANPFKCTDNRVPALFPNILLNSRIDKWVNGNWVINNYAEDDYSNPVWDVKDMVIYPGEGVLISSPSAQTITFTGEIMQGCNQVKLNTGLTLLSSPIARTPTFDPTVFPLSNGDIVHKVTSTTGSTTAYTYNNGSWSPSTPSIAIGEAFWVDKDTVSTWVQNCSVW